MAVRLLPRRGGHTIRRVGLQQEIRRAESRSLPTGQRVLALCRCAETYSPIGFQTTPDFLEENAGPFRTEEGALLAATEMLRQAHALWQQELREYAAQRRAEKRAGQRSPRPLDRNPNQLQTWHGREQEAALFSVRRWRDRTGGLSVTDERGRQLRALADRALTTGLSNAELASLESLLRQAEAEVNWETYQADANRYFRNRTLARIAHHVRIAAGPRTSPA
jgi:hypothetical protein